MTKKKILKMERTMTSEEIIKKIEKKARRIAGLESILNKLTIIIFFISSIWFISFGSNELVFRDNPIIGQLMFYYYLYCPMLNKLTLTKYQNFRVRKFKKSTSGENLLVFGLIILIIATVIYLIYFMGISLIFAISTEFALFKVKYILRFLALCIFTVVIFSKRFRNSNISTIIYKKHEKRVD